MRFPDERPPNTMVAQMLFEYVQAKFFYRDGKDEAAIRNLAKVIATYEKNKKLISDPEASKACENSLKLLGQIVYNEVLRDSQTNQKPTRK